MQAKAAAIVEREEKEVNYCLVLASIVEIEVTIEKSEKQLCINSTRPDLHPNCKQLRNMKSDIPAYCKE